MTRREEALNAFAVAAHREFRAQEELRAARVAKARALRMLHYSGVPKCHVGATARNDLREHGFSEEMIIRLALSDASVRLILGRT